MRLLRFECHDFRCLCEPVFEPAPGINIIRGDNGQGKTSLVEAIFFAATSKSHRTNADAEMIAHGTMGFRLKADAERLDRKVTIEAIVWQGAKRFRVNGIPQARLSDVLGKIHVVMFSPEDIILVKGTAANRRKFLDMELSQIDVPYLHALQNYRQALKQRNELLRSHKVDEVLLDVWDEQLIQHGRIVMQGRQAFISQLAALSQAAYAEITGGERLDVAYQPDVPKDSELRGALAKARASDIRRQMTTHGPHRDDFDINVNRQLARSFASQGQQKAASLALKLAELALVRERTGEHPILMLDEVLSELDEKRARMLFASIDPEVQCFVTTTKDLSTQDSPIQHDCAFYKIERGRLEQEERP